MNKQQDILQAAERLFYTNGFHATSTDLICSEAQVSTRTFYRYFPSRETLTLRVMEERQKRFFADLHPPQHPEAVSKLFDVLEQWIRKHGALGCFFAKAWGEYNQQDIILAARALDYRYALREYIAACASCSRSPLNEGLINAIWMLFEGAVISALVMGPDAAVQAKHTALLLISSHEKKQ